MKLNDRISSILHRHSPNVTSHTGPSKRCTSTFPRTKQPPAISNTAVKIGEGSHLAPTGSRKPAKNINEQLKDAIEKRDDNAVKTLITKENACCLFESKGGQKINLVAHLMNLADQADRMRSLQTFPHYDVTMELLRKCPDFGKAYDQWMQRSLD